MESQTCPKGHILTSGHRFCITCGWRKPLQAGEQIGDYRVLQHKALLDKYLYLVEANQASFFLVESLEFFQPEYREQIFATVDPLLNDLGTPLLSYFVDFCDDLPLLYSVYAAECWPEPENDLQALLCQQGLFSPAELQAVYKWLQQFVHRLWQKGYVHPGLITPMLFKRPQGFFLLDWEYCVPADDSLHFPQFYQGYHTPVYLKHLDQVVLQKQRNLTLASQAFYATLMELICGRSPTLWMPEPISSRTCRFLLAPKLRDWLDVLAKQVDFGKLPTSLPGTYSDNPELQDALRRANRVFHQAMPLMTAKHAGEARALLETAVNAHLNDAQAFCALALTALHAGQALEFEEYLGRAIQIEPLARFYYELAKGRLQLEDPDAAIKALYGALKQFQYYPDAWFLLGQIQMQKQAHAPAEEALLKAWQLNKSPKYAKVLYDFFMEHDLPDQAQQFAAHFSPASGGKLQYVFEPKLKETTPLPPLAAGQKLGAYRILARLNSNQIKSCLSYLVEDESGQRFYLREYPPSAQQRAKTEIYAVLVLRHPAIQPLAGVIESERGSTCLVYSELEGETLEDRLKRVGVLNQAQVVDILGQIGSLLQAFAAHQPAIIHGDIKPANLFLTSDGRVLLLDFESVRLMGHKKEVVPFTFPYAPPELETYYQVHPSTDFYALAMTLVHALSGVYPQGFVEYSRQQIDGWQEYTLHIESELRQLLAQWLQWKPEQRVLPGWDAFYELLDRLRQAPASALSDERLAWLEAYRHVYLSQTQTEVRQWGQRLLDCKPDLQALRSVAGNYLRLGLLQEALQLGMRALQLDPAHLQSVWLLAEIYKQLKLYPAAIAVLARSLDVCSDQQHSFIMLAHCYILNGQLDLAQAAYRRAENLPPSRLELHVEQLRLMMQRQAYTEVKFRCENLLHQAEISPQDRAELHTILGAVHGKQERYAQALKELLKAEKLHSNPQRRYDIGLSYFHLGKYVEAVAYFTRALVDLPEHLPSQYFLGRSYLELGQYAQALAWLQKLENKPQKPDDLYFLLGRAYSLLGNYIQAQEAYLNALRLMPHSPAVLVNLGCVYLDLGKPAPALEMARKALKLMPTLDQARKLESLAEQMGQAS